MSSIISFLTEPGRRHRCEICLDVFLCHICQIDWTHPSHESTASTSRYSYICTKCSERTGRSFVLLIGGRHYNEARLFNYLTGKLVWVKDTTKRKELIRRWYGKLEEVKL